MTTVVGVFSDRTETEGAIDVLIGHGFTDEQVGVIWRERSVLKPEEIEVTRYVDHFEGPAREARKGAVGGALGGSVGVGAILLASAGGIAIPGVGLLAAAGALGTAAAMTAGAVGGSIAGTLIGALLGATDHDATKVTFRETTYAEVLEREGFVVTIETDDESRAIASLQAAGASDVSVLDESGRHRAEPETTSGDTTPVPQ